MSLELVVDAREDSVWLALLCDGKLIEVQEQQSDMDFAVGDIYLGKVRKVVPSLNAAFVDVGYEKDAFLHYLDLGPQFSSLNKFTKNTLKGKQNVADLLYFKPEKDIDKDGKINDVLSASANILVQVAKEPISNKGPRLCSEITLAGRYLVLVPFSDKISISQKIKNPEERARLKSVLENIKPKNFGVIIRTIAENKKLELLDQDLKNLVEKWKTMYGNLKNSAPPKRVLGEVSKTLSMLRDLLNADFTNIHVNDKGMSEEISDFVSDIAPGREKIVRLHSNRINIFEKFGVNRQIKMLFGKKVPLPSGGYLIIEHTEAMHVIDVNSGNRKGAEGQESNALATNIEAAEEIARVLQLRDMGGIIVIDFIDMHTRENNKILHEKLKGFMHGDRAKHNILSPSKFGVVEITRQRVRPETDIKTSDKCPTCNGTGEVQASILYAEEIESQLKHLVTQRNMKKITLVMHPFLASYFTKGLMSRQMKWYLSYKTWVKIKEDTTIGMVDYIFQNEKGKKIKV